MSDMSYHATQLAQARHALVVAEEKQAEALMRVENLKERIFNIDAKRKEITGRRVVGKHTDTDIAEFGVLTADMDVLAELLETAEEQAEELEPHTQRDDVRLAEDAVRECERRETVDALHYRAKQLEALFVGCLAELARQALASGRINLRDVYLPSEELKTVTSRTELRAIAALAPAAEAQ